MHYRNFLIAVFFSLPATLFAQDVTGLWKGTMYNDTTQQFYKYEIGISKEKGKYSGFSHTWFLLGDKQYYGVKKVTIKIAPDGKIIVEDDGLIANNYPVSPSKNVKQLNVLTLSASNSMMTLEGPFTTNKTREYHSITGKVTLQRKNDFWQSALVPHLQELGLQNKLSFVKEENDLLAFVEAKQEEAILKQLEQQYQDQNKADKKQAATEKALHEATKQKEKEEQELAKQQEFTRTQNESALVKEKAADKLLIKQQAEERQQAEKLLVKKEADAKAQTEKEISKNQADQQLLAKKQTEEKIKKQAELAKQEAVSKARLEKEIAKQETAKQQLVKQQAGEKIVLQKALAKQEAASKQNAENELAKQVAAKQQLIEKVAKQKLKEDKELAKQTAAAKLPQEKEMAKSHAATTFISNTLAAAGVNERKTEVQQTVYFSSDSLILSLYDNGEIDGDTVSVLMNGSLIVAKQGLSTTAAKTTIYIPSNMDRVELVMYAESLGSIPPNTGLLVIRDGKDLYEIRFSGDLQKNASIVFNRKKE